MEEEKGRGGKKKGWRMEERGGKERRSGEEANEKEGGDVIEGRGGEGTARVGPYPRA